MLAMHNPANTMKMTSHTNTNHGKTHLASAMDCWTKLNMGSTICPLLS